MRIDNCVYSNISGKQNRAQVLATNVAMAIQMYPKNKLRKMNAWLDRNERVLTYTTKTEQTRELIVLIYTFTIGTIDVVLTLFSGTLGVTLGTCMVFLMDNFCLGATLAARFSFLPRGI